MELLNGKSKELFEQWYLSNHKHYDKLTVLDEGKLNQFYRLPEVMKNALIIEWLDSIGYYIENWGINIVNYKIGFDFQLMREGKLISISEGFFSSRQQATTEAIKKAVELINESNGK